MPVYTSGPIDFVIDNNGRYFIIDPITRTRYETGGPGSGSFKAAVALYGSPRDSGTELSGWREHPGGAVNFFGGPNMMEQVIAGHRPDPFTGTTVPNPQAIRTGTGELIEPPGTEAPTTTIPSYWGSNYVPETVEGIDASGNPVTINTQPGTYRDGRRVEEEGAAGGGSLTRQERNAFATARELLREYGLESLADDVREWVVQGLSQIEIVQRIRATSEYKTRFAGLLAREENGLNPITETEYLRLEDAYRGILRRTEMPTSFYDSYEDFAQFIANDISPSELETRIADGIVAAQTAPQEVRDALARYYGIGNTVSALAAYYLDPERGEETILREFRTAQIAGASTRTGFGNLDLDDAARLESLGITAQQAQTGFASLQGARELMDALPGEVGSETLTRDEQLGAAFEGDVEAQEELRRQRERRLGAFATSVGTPLATREGVVGAGSSE